MQCTGGKAERLRALAGQDGVIAGLALDHRGGLQKLLAMARGVDVKEITAAMMREFKVSVARILAPHASAILLDPEFGLDAARIRAASTGLLLTYETSGFDNSRPGRLPELLPHVTVRSLRDWGASGVKLAVYYTPFESADVNATKHAFVERVGAECSAWEMPFFLEVVGYDPRGSAERTLEYARAKPEIVRRGMAEFSQERYRVDVLKVEVPVNVEFVEGSAVYRGQKAYTRAEALRHFRDAAAVSARPFIYLSAGVTHAAFIESLALAGEAGVAYSGVLCGRATWKQAIPVYACHGVRALEEWLAGEGVHAMNAVKDAIRPAIPWYGS